MNWYKLRIENISCCLVHSSASSFLFFDVNAIDFFISFCKLSRIVFARFFFFLLAVYLWQEYIKVYVVYVSVAAAVEYCRRSQTIKNWMSWRESNYLFCLDRVWIEMLNGKEKKNDKKIDMNLNKVKFSQANQVKKFFFLFQFFFIAFRSNVF